MSNLPFAIKPAIKSLSVLTSLSLLLGCASQQPAPQFVEAERTYADVSEGKAQEFAPDELLEAKNLLNAARDAKNGSPRQVQLAYLADRQARLALSSGTIEYYQKQASSSQSKYIAGLEKKSSSTQEQLATTQRELSTIEEEMQQKDANVEALQARKAELESKRQELESQLNDSEQGRKEAEARAAAAMASLNELAKVKEEAHETVITLSGSVLFKTGEAELLPIAANNLTKVAEAIKTMDDEKQIVIEGYTDSRGAEDMNQKLSKERAESVMSYLAKEGVDSSRMKAVGKGEANPVATNDSPEGRANNRRVELHITAGDKASKSAASDVNKNGSSS